MARPVTLFTGQWADLPLEELAEKAAAAGASTASSSPAGATTSTSPRRCATPATSPAAASCSSATGCSCWAIGNHLVGQAVCDPIDERHRRRAAARGLGRRRPRGRPPARRRADEGHRPRGRAARRRGRRRASPARRSGTCSTRSRRTTSTTIERGYEDFAERWNPIIDVFEAEGVRFALEVHPTEIAYDFVTTRKTLEAIGDRDGLRHQLRPEPPRAPVPRLGGVRRRVRATASTTSTSRTPSAGSTGARRSSAAT